jgi:hypothetical protein
MTYVIDVIVGTDSIEEAEAVRDAVVAAVTARDMPAAVEAPVFRVPIEQVLAMLDDDAEKARGRRSCSVALSAYHVLPRHYSLLACCQVPCR